MRKAMNHLNFCAATICGNRRSIPEPIDVSEGERCSRELHPRSFCRCDGRRDDQGLTGACNREVVRRTRCSLAHVTACPARSVRRQDRSHGLLLRSNAFAAQRNEHRETFSEQRASERPPPRRCSVRACLAVGGTTSSRPSQRELAACGEVRIRCGTRSRRRSCRTVRQSRT